MSTIPAPDTLNGDVTPAIPRGLETYARWANRHRVGRPAWVTIAQSGIKLAKKDNQGRALMYMSLSYVLGTCTLFYFLYLVEAYAGSPEVRGYAEFLKQILRIDLTDVTQLSSYRPVVWRAVFFVSIKAQIFWIGLVASRIGPGLISDDLKSRALPIYFARPITPAGYLWGKWLVLAVYIAWLSLIPNLLTLTFASVLTGGLGWGPTLALATDLAVVGVGLMVVAGAILLALSALGTDKRYVVVAWIALCVLPSAAQAMLYGQLDPELLRGWLGSISLYGNTAVLSEWVLDLKALLAGSPLQSAAFRNAMLSQVQPIYPAIVLGTLTVLGLVVAYRRVVQFSRSAANL